MNKDLGNYGIIASCVTNIFTVPKKWEEKIRTQSLKKKKAMVKSKYV